MKHLAAVCTPIHAAAVEGRIVPHDAIEAAYRFGHAPKEGMTSDDVVAEVSAPDRKSVPKVAHHCKPLQKLHDEGRITLEKAIEASYKLGVEERESDAPVVKAEPEVEAAPEAVPELPVSEVAAEAEPEVESEDEESDDSEVSDEAEAAPVEGEEKPAPKKRGRKPKNV